MIEIRKICDRCKCIVSKDQPLYSVAIYPKYYNLCRDCTYKLIQRFRQFCENEID